MKNEKIPELKKGLGHPAVEPTIVTVIKKDIICLEGGATLLPKYSVTICVSCSKQKAPKIYCVKKKEIDVNLPNGYLHVNRRGTVRISQLCKTSIVDNHAIENS